MSLSRFLTGLSCDALPSSPCRLSDNTHFQILASLGLSTASVPHRFFPECAMRICGRRRRRCTRKACLRRTRCRCCTIWTYAAEFLAHRTGDVHALIISQVLRVLSRHAHHYGKQAYGYLYVMHAGYPVALAPVGGRPRSSMITHLHIGTKSLVQSEHLCTKRIHLLNSSSLSSAKPTAGTVIRLRAKGCSMEGQTRAGRGLAGGDPRDQGDVVKGGVCIHPVFHPLGRSRSHLETTSKEARACRSPSQRGNECRSFPARS